jgi:hypothetical protein
MKITIKKNLILGMLKFWFCKFHPRQMWCEPFLSPPKMCRFFAKQVVMWATFQSIGLQEACVISSIWSFFPKPMKDGPHLWIAFCTVPWESWNTNARWRHNGTGAGNSYLYAERGPWWTTGIAIPQQLHNATH